MSKKNNEKDDKPDSSNQAKVVKLNQNTEKGLLADLFVDLQKLSEEIESHIDHNKNQQK